MQLTALMAKHLHPEAVPTAVLGSIIATATVYLLGFVSVTLQEDSLIKERLMFWQPGKEWIILQKFECATRTGQLYQAAGCRFRLSGGTSSIVSGRS
jgi:hypothetical protein